MPIDPPSTATPQAPLQDLGSAERLGQQVRAQRKQQGLRIDDAAALSGVSVDLLSRLENGAGSVRLDKLMNVLDSLGLTLMVAPKGHPLVQTTLSRTPCNPVNQDQEPTA